MKRTIPKSLVQRQEKTRKDTVEMVAQAILVLESQGYNIKIKDLISVTGLSRSVFAKPHIREVLVEYGIIQTQTPEKTAGAESTRRMDRLIAEKNGYIQRLLHENEQLRYEVELLRGKEAIKTFCSLQRMMSWGVNSKTLNLPRAREHHETEVINRGVEPKSDLCLWGASPQQATGRFPVTEISLFIKFV